MNISKKILLLWVIFALLDPDPDFEYGSGSGSTDPIESGSNPDPQPWKIQFLNPDPTMGKSSGSGFTRLALAGLPEVRPSSECIPPPAGWDLACRISPQICNHHRRWSIVQERKNWRPLSMKNLKRVRWVSLADFSPCNNSRIFCLQNYVHFLVYLK